MQRIINLWESFEFNPKTIFWVVLGAIFVRTFLENFSNPEPTALFSPIRILVNYSTFYYALFFCFVFLVTIATGRKILSVANSIAIGFFVIVTPPIFDLLLSGGKGFCMGYMGESGIDLLKKFFLFFFQNPLFCGATPGIKIEAIIVMVTLCIYITYKTKKFWKGLLTAFGAYTVVFIFGAFPGIIGTLAHVPTSEVSGFLQNTLSHSLVSSVHNFNTQVGMVPTLLDQTSLLLSRIQWVFVVIFIAIAWAIQSKHSWAAWWKGSLNKIPLGLVYMGTMVIGMGIAALTGNVVLVSFSFTDVLGLVILFTSLFFAFWVVSITNDIQDVAIDRDVNKDRPLPAGTLSVEQFQSIRFFAAIFSVTGILMINYNVAVCLGLFYVAYFLHSSVSQFKQHWLSSGICIFFAALGAEMMGYFFITQDQTFSHFPIIVGLAFPTLFLILSNLKDIPDKIGDAKASIQTLPVVIGERFTVRLIAAALVVWSIVFHSFISWTITSIVIAFTLICLGVYENKRVFPSKVALMYGIIGLFTICTILVFLTIIGSLYLW